MNFFLPIDIPALNPAIRFADKIYLTGSCFTEHIGNYFSRAKFSVMQNSHGILFNPISVCNGLEDVMDNKKYSEDELFFLDEYWHSWYHHSEFSDMDKNIVLQKINDTIETHHNFLEESKFLIITLGSAFAYNLIEKDFYVSNNHRAPHAWFRKALLPTDAIIRTLKKMQQKLFSFNPNCKIIFTVSPVRHSRDGVIENNRSKARLLEAVHSMADTYYFPAYEIVIDVLRDYRFYDADLVHPNYAATQYVWEKFVTHCIDASCLETMKEMEDIYKAFHHKPKSTNSEAHKKLLAAYKEKCFALKERFPFVDLEREMGYFGGA